MKQKRILLPFVLLILVLSLFLTSFTKPASAKNAQEYTVTIDCYWYNPGSLTIPVGSTVIWKNTCGQHSVTSNTGEFDSGPLEEGQIASHVFSTRGVFFYHCTLHPDMKKGEVVVQ